MDRFIVASRLGLEHRRLIMTAPQDCLTLFFYKITEASAKLIAYAGVQVCCHWRLINFFINCLLILSRRDLLSSRGPMRTASSSSVIFASTSLELLTRCSPLLIFRNWFVIFLEASMNELIIQTKGCRYFASTPVASMVFILPANFSPCCHLSVSFRFAAAASLLILLSHLCSCTLLTCM